MEIFLIPLALFGTSIFLYFKYKKVKKQYENISSVERSSVAEIMENHDHFLIEFGPETYQHYVEIYGVVKSDSPIISPIAAKSCIYLDYKIQRKYEVRVQERDSQGRTVTRMQHQTEILSSNLQSIPFKIEDGGLEIEVLPELADVFPVKSHFSQPAYLDPALAGKMGISTSYREGNTLGFTLTENIIPTGHQLYVLGEANDRSGRLAISKPRDKNQSFILSTTHEDVLLQKLSVKVKWFRIGFYFAFIIGIITVAVCIFLMSGRSLTN